jgi:predicted DNA-binding transcriptional regulator AlpA
MSTTNPSLKLITAEELATRLSMKEQAVWRLHRLGKIPHYDLGGRMKRYDLEEVMQALQKVHRPATAI